VKDVATGIAAAHSHVCCFTRKGITAHIALLAV